MKKISYILLSISVVMLVSMLLISCGDSGSNGGSSSTGNVALFVTDDISLEYKQVEGIIKRVQLLQTGTNTMCTFVKDPVNLDITELSSMIQLLDVEDCKTGNYNRIHIEFEQEVMLRDHEDLTSPCWYKSYKDEQDNPNILQCVGDTCFIDMNGNVKVLQNQTEEVVLDFDLKKFEVEDFKTLECSLTMKVSPLNKSSIDKKHDDGYKKGISGYVSDVNSFNKKFTLTTESGFFIVSYDNVDKEGIESVLNLAVSDNLEVMVKSMRIDLENDAISALGIYLKMEGNVSKLDINNSILKLTYQTDKAITIDYNNAEIEGILEVNSFVKIKLIDHNGTHYISDEVEVEDAEDAEDKEV